jgi:glycosyltransferase involved in cell wall biosynthesis
MMSEEKIPVTYIQRKARGIGNYSLEFIFNDVRNRLRDKIDARIVISTFESRGLFKRLFNCLQAFIAQGKYVTHITGDVNYLGLFLSQRRTIHTILDCVFLDSTSGMKHRVLKYFWLTVPLKRSAYITAISSATKQEILKYSSCDPDKIVVIPVAISQGFSFEPKTFNADKPVILQIGTAHNKNVPRTLQALSGISCKIVIIGKYNEEYEQMLKQGAFDYSFKSGLSDEEMKAEYRNADIISFPSTYEGFGMPILEGQATGRIVVTSNVSSMPEVAGEAAILVDPFDVQSIRSGFLEAIKNDALRGKLLAKGMENIQRYEPQHIANMYLGLYKKLCP